MIDVNPMCSHCGSSCFAGNSHYGKIFEGRVNCGTSSSSDKDASISDEVHHQAAADVKAEFLRITFGAQDETTSAAASYWRCISIEQRAKLITADSRIRELEQREKIALRALDLILWIIPKDALEETKYLLEQAGKEMA